MKIFPYKKFDPPFIRPVDSALPDGAKKSAPEKRLPS
jgi:hypothetical protein